MKSAWFFSNLWFSMKHHCQLIPDHLAADSFIWKKLYGSETSSLMNESFPWRLRQLCLAKKMTSYMGQFNKCFKSVFRGDKKSRIWFLRWYRWLSKGIMKFSKTSGRSADNRIQIIESTKIRLDTFHIFGDMSYFLGFYICAPKFTLVTNTWYWWHIGDIIYWGVGDTQVEI